MSDLIDGYVALPPRGADLPSSDGVPMETQRHQTQMDLLINSLLPWLNQRSDGYVGGNMFVYFSLAQVRTQDFRGPDFFAVLGVPKGERRNWVVWEEGKGPDVVIELLSESTAEADKQEKKLIYQNKLRVPEYYWFDPFNPDDWEGFHLANGEYQPIERSGDRFFSSSLNLFLVLWQGYYRGIEATWLRWRTRYGELLLTGEEAAEQERQRAEQERQRAEQERQRAEQERQRAEQAETRLQQTAQVLLQEGMSRDQVAEITGLSVSVLEQL